MPLSSIPIRNVDIKSAFWSPIQMRARSTTVPAIFASQKEHGHWPCLTWKEGHKEKPHQFWDSDIYKAVEAACYSMIRFPDPHIRAMVEEAVDMIRAAQHPDGYINSYYTVRGIDKRWTNMRDDHELYCMGHLLEATVAYEVLNNNGRLLEVATKLCTHLDANFGIETGKKRGYPGHQEIEIGLLRLHEINGDPLALKLARYFILERGMANDKGETYFDLEAYARGGDPFDFMGPEMKAWYHAPRDYSYQQAHERLTLAREVKGHAVRAMYYYTAATDLVRLSDPTDTEIGQVKAAIDGLWRNLVDCKMYVTGGIGSDRQTEGFASAYQLPDLEIEGCYAETCATFALINWCARLLQLKLNAEYADVMETALYNGFLGAVSGEGDAFYYQNVLRTTNGNAKERSKWFGVACCPPNVAKLLGNMASLIYTCDPQHNMLAIHQYIESKVDVPEMDNCAVMTTSLPWSGHVAIRTERNCKLALRIPSWADQWTTSAQGDIIDGYLHINALAGKDITLDFQVQPRRVYVNPKTGKDDICIRRGPLVYCFEDVDNTGVDIDTLQLLDVPVEDGDTIAFSGMNQIQTVVATAVELAKDEDDKSSLYSPRPWSVKRQTQRIVAIPYFLRANRCSYGAMRVWVPRTRTYAFESSNI